jgi:tetratricopeptide (TPR) repeat protein
VLLDNARSAEQVRPLLPATPGCVTVVTSRDALAGLVARDGARRLDLDLLAPAEAKGLLTELIGDRAVADQDAAQALAEQCSRLPLALRVAAELAAESPARPLAELVGELTDERRRLDLLDAGGDPRTAVRAVFSWSYRRLDPAAARLFRLAGLHPGPDLDRYAAAALAASTAEEAGDILDRLDRAHLVQRTEPGRYGLHDLLRAYARELATGPGGDEAQAALTRLFDYYLQAAAAAMDTLFPADKHRRPTVPPMDLPAPPLASPAAATDWLNAQRATLVAVTAHTAAHGWPRHATRLAATLAVYLSSGGHYTEEITVQTCARRAARAVGDRSAEAAALHELGYIGWQQGRYRRADGLFQQSLELYRQAGDGTGEARALNALGLSGMEQGRYEQAAAHFGQALGLFRRVGDRYGQCRVLGNLGVVERRRRHYQQAIDYQEQCLALCRQIGDRSGEGTALARLGVAEMWLGRYPEAAAHHRQALALCRDTGYRAGEADALTSLGDVEERQQRYQQAAGHHRQAVALYTEFGSSASQAQALNSLGRALLASGQADEARAEHTTALDLACQVGDKYREASAHDGLARCYRAAGNPGQARYHWQQALARYTELDAPDADLIRAELDGLNSGSPAQAGQPARSGR